MKRHCFKICLIIFILSYVQACTTINQPRATVDLVNTIENESTTPAPQGLQAALSNAESSVSVTIGGVAYTVDTRYRSATGRVCRKVKSAEFALQVYCQIENGSWIQVRQIIANYASSNAAINQSSGKFNTQASTQANAYTHLNTSTETKE